MGIKCVIAKSKHILWVHIANSFIQLILFLEGGGEGEKIMLSHYF